MTDLQLEQIWTWIANAAFAIMGVCLGWGIVEARRYWRSK
jgi:hypothetical protein